MVSFRVNSLKSSVDSVLSDLKLQGISPEPVSWYQYAFLCPDIDPSTLTQLDMYKSGRIYIQNLSSMKPALYLNPTPNSCVLDLCASPGSKTSQLASMMKNTGELIACEISKGRIYKLAAVLKSQGVTNTKIINLPGQILWKRYPEYFDYSLVDVPCSMDQTGTSCNSKAKQLVPKQRYLLRSAISATKTGGTIVYSTCSTTSCENEEVIDWIMSKEVGIVEVVEAERVSPTERQEGFYICKLKKLKSNL